MAFVCNPPNRNQPSYYSKSLDSSFTEKSHTKAIKQRGSENLGIREDKCFHFVSTSTRLNNVFLLG